MGRLPILQVFYKGSTQPLRGVVECFSSVRLGPQLSTLVPFVGELVLFSC